VKIVGTQRLTQKQREGKIAWRQGFIYKLIFPPYGADDIINTRKPIEGVAYARGIGSAQLSLITKYGKVPEVVRRDMGIVDIKISTPPGTHPWERRRSRIMFTSDKKQKTRVTPKTKQSGKIPPGISTTR